MADRYNSLDNTAPVVSPLENTTPSVPYSAFNLSCMKYFTGMFGAIMPFDCFRTLPNGKYTLQYDVLAKLRNPLVRPLLSGCRIYLHSYYNRDSDLWEGANNFYTKGRSGTLNLRKPVLKHKITMNNKQYSTITPMSPSGFLGLPPEVYDNSNSLTCYKMTELTDETKVYKVPDEVDALKLVMYQRLYRDKYAPKNLLQNNKKILPDNEEHFILPYEADEVFYLDYHQPNYNGENLDLDPNGEMYIPSADSNKPLVLDSLKFRQFKGDYFTSALPFPDLIRGDAPTINIGDINASIDWSNVVKFDYQGDSSNFNVLQVNRNTDTILARGSSLSEGDEFTDSIKRALNKAVINATASASLNLNDFRALEAYTIFMERNARTDGDYDSLIRAQFGHNPHTGNKEAIYIGGSYQDMVFSDVTQTSESSESSPLGSRAGQGISASSGYIGKFTAPDYGYIMTVMTIVPDTIYTTGIDREWTELSQSEQYFPILNNLSPQPILNKELFYSDDVTGNDVYAYNERFSHYKSRRSKAMGLIGLPHDKATYDASCIMARRFETTPQLNNKFLTLSPENVDMSPFSVIDEPPFDLSVGCRVDAVLPIPYLTIPGGLDSHA